MKGQRCRPRRTPLPALHNRRPPSLSRPPGELRAGLGRGRGRGCSLGAQGRARADLPPGASCGRTQGGGRLGAPGGERAGHGPGGVPEGGQGNGCLGAPVRKRGLELQRLEAGGPDTHGWESGGPKASGRSSVCINGTAPRTSPLRETEGLRPGAPLSERNDTTVLSPIS